MTTEECLEKLGQELTAAKRRNRPLILLGVLLMAVAPLLFMSWGTAALQGAGLLVTREDVRCAGWIVAGTGSTCIVLGCIPFRARLLSLGIALLGVATAIAGWVFAVGYFGSNPHWHFRPQDMNTVAVCGFMIAVTGLIGLVCAVLGMARLLAGRKGT